MLNKKGLTLTEIIIAIALLGIIAIGVLPGFTAQLKIMNQGTGLTQMAFEAQGDVERAIFAVRDKIKNGEALTSITEITLAHPTFLGRQIEMARMERSFPSNSGKRVFVYLSQKLAEVEQHNLLVASGVRIEVNNDAPDNDMVADMKRTPLPTLSGEWTPDASVDFYDNIYKWYVSREGMANPVYPEDFTQIEIAGTDPATLDDLLTRAGANRYVMFSVTPVDINGLRGDEVESANMVYIMGTEWRSGIFAWIDKNNNGNNEIATDVMIGSLKYKDLAGFDSSIPYQNPVNPGVNLDPSSGAFYVPMGVTPVGGAMTVTGVEALNWHIDKSINLAKGIFSDNGADIVLKTRDGNITLYQDIELDGSGNAEYDANGLVKTVNSGPELTTGGDILFSTDGSGMIGINDYSKLDSHNISLTANGQLYIKKADMQADGSVLIDTSLNAGVPGNRDIYIDGSVIKLNSNGTTGRVINIKSRNAIALNAVNVTGNGSASSYMLLNSKTGSTLTNSTLSGINVSANDNTVITGGSWSAGKTLTIADGKTLTLKKGTARVANNGYLNLQNTGSVDFPTDMSVDLKYPLTIDFGTTANSNEVLISTSYGRNIGYADGSSAQSVSNPGDYRDLGAGQANLEFTADKVAGTGNIGSLSYSFDGNNMISITGTATGATTENVVLTVRDKYSHGNILRTVNFTFSASAAGPATIVVTGDSVPIEYTVIFEDFDNTVLKTEQVIYGNAATAPIPPSRSGYNFIGWDTDFSNVTSNMTVTAQYTQIPVYTVIFNKNGGTTDAVPASMQVLQGGTVGTLPTPPTRTNYGFNGWNTQSNGTGTAFTASTVVNGNITVYAQYLPIYTVTFDRNGGNTNANPSSIQVMLGQTVVNLPAPPTRNGYAFTSWNTRSNGSGSSFTANTVVNANITVYAQWRSANTVTFNKNGGTTEANPMTLQVFDGDPIGTLPTPPSRTGYVFDGWNTQANGNGNDVTVSTRVYWDFTAYAQWRQYHTVTFNKNGGTTEANPMTIQVLQGDSVGTLPTPPTRTGYGFDGWETQSNGNGSSFTASTAVNSDITVYAQWRQYRTVTFNKNGGTTEANPMTIQVLQGNSVGTLPTPPTRTGYSFDGWETQANGSGSSFTASTVVNSDITVYAQWRQYRTVTFNKNGGTTEASPMTIQVLQGDSVGTLPTPPTRTGRTFRRWRTQADGGGTTFDGNTTVNADITVYAQWW